MSLRETMAIGKHCGKCVAIIALTYRTETLLTEMLARLFGLVQQNAGGQERWTLRAVVGMFRGSGAWRIPLPLDPLAFRL